jgi:hypothetical protein
MKMISARAFLATPFFAVKKGVEKTRKLEWYDNS